VTFPVARSTLFKTVIAASLWSNCLNFEIELLCEIAQRQNHAGAKNKREAHHNRLKISSGRIDEYDD
jgi:hypothetical protein